MHTNAVYGLYCGYALCFDGIPVTNFPERFGFASLTLVIVQVPGAAFSNMD